MKVLLKLDGEVLATLEGEGVEHGRRADPKSATWRGSEMIPDPKVFVLRRDGKTLFVLNVGTDARVTTEELP